MEVPRIASCFEKMYIVFTEAALFGREESSLEESSLRDDDTEKGETKYPIGSSVSRAFPDTTIKCMETVKAHSRVTTNNSRSN